MPAARDRISYEVVHETVDFDARTLSFATAVPEVKSEQLLIQNEATIGEDNTEYNMSGGRLNCFPCPALN